MVHNDTRTGWASRSDVEADESIDLSQEFATYVDDAEPDDEDHTPEAAPDRSPRAELNPGAPTENAAAARPRPRHRAAELRSPTRVAEQAPAREGWRGALNLVGLRLKPGPQERTTRESRRTICVNFSRAVTATVVNPDGGSGKTPATAILAGALGLERGGGVVAWDNNELRGALALRTDDGGRAVTVRDLLNAGNADTGRREDVDRYLRHQQAGHYKVMASADGGEVLVSAEEFNRVHTLLSRYYEVMVIDTGNNEAAPNWQAALKVTDQLVVPVKWKMTSCTIAAHMLEDLERRGMEDLVAGAVIVAMNGPGDASSKHRGKYLEYFTDRARAVIEIPTDSHIHADGVIEHDALQPETLRAINQLASVVATGLAEADQRGPRMNSQPADAHNPTTRQEPQTTGQQAGDRTI